MTVTGNLDEQMRAVDLIVSKLSEDPHYTQSMNAPFSYPGVPAYDHILNLLLLKKNLHLWSCLGFLHANSATWCDCGHPLLK